VRGAAERGLVGGIFGTVDRFRVVVGEGKIKDIE